MEDPFSDLLKKNCAEYNKAKLNDDLAYEILSVVEDQKLFRLEPVDIMRRTK